MALLPISPFIDIFTILHARFHPPTASLTYYSLYSLAPSLLTTLSIYILPHYPTILYARVYYPPRQLSLYILLPYLPHSTCSLPTHSYNLPIHLHLYHSICSLLYTLPISLYLDLITLSTTFPSTPPSPAYTTTLPPGTSPCSLPPPIAPCAPSTGTTHLYPSPPPALPAPASTRITPSTPLDPLPPTSIPQPLSTPLRTDTLARPPAGTLLPHL